MGAGLGSHGARTLVLLSFRGFSAAARSKADEHFRRALDQFPHSVTALLFLAESLTAQKKTDEARTLLQRVIDAPAEAEWAPEVRDFKRKAADRLHALGPAGRVP